MNNEGSFNLEINNFIASRKEGTRPYCIGNKKNLNKFNNIDFDVQMYNIQHKPEEISAELLIKYKRSVKEL